MNIWIMESEDKKEVSVIYRGSEGPGTKDSAVDTFDNDLLLHVKINM
ncbi:TPA: hypothetical protein U3N20_000910 [Streptococcus agalactiae]|nr:hypothetical protein [Streptococcus agalactiae]